MLKAVGAFEYAGGDMDFCEKNLLRYKVCDTRWVRVRSGEAGGGAVLFC